MSRLVYAPGSGDGIFAGTFAPDRHHGDNLTVARVFVGIGSNLDDRDAYLDMARRRLEQMARTRLVAFSGVYETDPVGPIPQGRFLNAAAELQTDLDPVTLLRSLTKIETESGRPIGGERVKWGPRTLDLDILLYDQRVISSDDLVVPHPMMHERWFVLKPLCDIDTGVLHPLLQMTVGELLKYVVASD